MKKYFFNALLLGVVLVGGYLIYERVNSTPPMQESLAYSDFIDKVKHGQVDRVEISGQMIKVRTSDGQNLETFNPGDPHIIDDLLTNNVQIRTLPPEQESFFMRAFMSWFPMIVLIGVWIFFMRRMQPGGGSNNFGKSKAKMLEEDKLTVKFVDVAGCEEAKEEVTELVDFFKSAAKIPTVGRQNPPRHTDGRPSWYR